MKNGNYLYLLKRLIKEYIVSYWGVLSIAVFCMIIVSCCTATTVKLIEPAVNQVFIIHDKKILFTLTIAIVLISFIRGIAGFFQHYLVTYIGKKILSDIQIHLYNHLINCDVEFIEKNSHSSLISRFTNDITLMRGVMPYITTGIARHLCSIILLTIVMFHTEPTMSILVFFVFPIAIYPIQRWNKKLRKKIYEIQQEFAYYTNKLDESFHAIKIIKSFSAEKIQVKKAKKLNDSIIELTKKIAKIDSLSTPLMEILRGIAISFILLYGGFLVFEGKTTPGSLISFIAAFVSVFRPFRSLVSYNTLIQEGLTAAKRIFYILDIKPKIINKINNIVLEKDNVSSIIFKDVKLTTNSNEIALSKVNLSIPIQKKIAIVGESGSGKTSLINLILRFYEPSWGKILINNLDIKNYSLESLRNCISLLTQESILFDASIAENIAYGNSNASREEIVTAAKYASADDFICSMPKKYDSLIKNNGVNLSRGQKQRIELARSFLKKSPILILDEATNALDFATEQQIYKSIENFVKNKTVIVVTHRLLTIKNMDYIIVMKKGSIVEQGTHKDLMDLKSEYYSLYLNCMSS